MESSLLIGPQIYLIPLAYMLGSIPFGVLIAKQKGIDIQNVGSRNIGTTNVLRAAGKVPAFLTLFGDTVKGAAAVLLGRSILGGELWEGVMGITAVLGHCFSIYLSFRGGKGVATGFGFLAVYTPVSAFFTLFVWVLTAVFTKYASLAAITACISLPVIVVLFDMSRTKFIFAILLALLIIIKHRENIKNLLHGTEERIGNKAQR
jgi:glycerol-3-phosphate acyltransferase PlsY